MEDEIAYCVTGATGYIGSWLVRSLLRRGFGVHATARDPGFSYCDTIKEVEEILTWKAN